MKYCFDIETDGLLNDVTKIWCIVLKDIDTNEVFKYGPANVRDGVIKMQGAELLIGHNIIAFDLPVIKKIYKYSQMKDKVFDTLVATRLVWADIKDKDFRNVNKGFPTKLIGRHSLKAWGVRLGNYKQDIETDWSEFTDEMLEYL